MARFLPGREEWGPNLQRIGALAAVLFLAAYGSDLALTATPRIPDAAESWTLATGQPPAGMWAYVPVLDDSGVPNGGEFRHPPIFDNVLVYMDLENNDLRKRVLELRRKVGVDMDGILRADVAAVPMRSLVHRVGGEFRWSGQGAACSRSSVGLISVEPGSARAQRNYVAVELPQPAFVEEDELYIPLRSAAMLYQMQLDRDPGSGVYTLSGEGRSLRIIVREQAFKIEIDRSDCWLQVYYAGRLAKFYKACTGEGQNTPVGRFHVQNKCVWPGWRAYWGEFIPGGTSRNPLGARFLGTSARGRVTGWTIGIHGTNQPSSIGRRISGGCVRLMNEHAIEVYEVIPIGTRVTVHE